LTLDGGVVVDDQPLSGSYTFTGLSDGAHTVTAQMADADHVVYANPEASDTAAFTVDTPITPTAVIPLFDRQSLDGLYPWFSAFGFSDPDQVFSVEDGLLHVTGQHWGGLITEAAYRD